MSRFLFIVPPFYGHVNPALNVVRGLTGRGEEVTFCTGPRYREAAEAAGASFQALRGARGGAGSPAGPAGPDGAGSLVTEPVIDRVFQILRATVEPARAWRPDCVVYDPMSLPGMMLARVLGVPAARLYTHLPVSAHYQPFDIFSPASPVRDTYPAFDRDLRQLCESYQVPAIGYREAVFHAEPLNIVPLPRSFVPAADSLPDSFRFTGPLFAPPAEQPAGKQDPYFPVSLLYVSMGTVFSGTPGFYDICITAFGGGSRPVVISTGDGVDHSLFGPLPDQVSLHHWVPQMEVLRNAAACVTHGGINSVMEALYYGVPLVAVPMRLEQEAVARQLAELQLGVVVDPASVTSHVLREAVARLEGDQEIRSAVARMQKLVREPGGPAEAVALLLQYAA